MDEKHEALFKEIGNLNLKIDRLVSKEVAPGRKRLDQIERCQTASSSRIASLEKGMEQIKVSISEVPRLVKDADRTEEVLSAIRGAQMFGAILQWISKLIATILAIGGTAWAVTKIVIFERGGSGQ